MTMSRITGLIQAYIVVGKFKDAIASAKEAIACLPRSSTAFCMMGKVLTQVPEGANEVSTGPECTHLPCESYWNPWLYLFCQYSYSSLCTASLFLLFSRPLSPSLSPSSSFSAVPSLCSLFWPILCSYVQAIRAYSKALRLSPSNSTAACCMAEVLLGQGKVEEAVQW
jgi:tetratricopeptide (TPR) repeat protein